MRAGAVLLLVHFALLSLVSQSAGRSLVHTSRALTPGHTQVKFTCGSHGWLFVNGKHVKDVHGDGKISIWSGPLKSGDTILIKGKSTGCGYGCTAEIKYRDPKGALKTRNTDLDFWRALSITPTQAKSLVQTLKKQPVRTWRPASKGNHPTKVNDKAISIWGADKAPCRANQPEYALIATTLGAPPVRNYGHIKFSCKDHGWLFINGKHVKDVHGGSRVSVWHGQLKTGDTILIKGKNEKPGFGCTAIITYRNEIGVLKSSTTDYKHWRALSITAVQAKHLVATLNKQPVPTWPQASHGTYATVLSPKTAIIWGPDKGGFALMATKLGAPPVPIRGSVRFSCDDHGWLFINGKHVKDVHGVDKIGYWAGPLKSGDSVLIKGKDDGGRWGCTAEIRYATRFGSIRIRRTNFAHWRALSISSEQAKHLPRTLKDSPVSSWPPASPGTFATRAGAHTHILWGAKRGGYALLATTLGSRPIRNYGFVRFSCDDHGWLFINGKHVKDVHGVKRVATWSGSLKTGDVIMIKGKDDGGRYGCTAYVRYRDEDGVVHARVSNYVHWRSLSISVEQAKKLAHTLKHSPVSTWPPASEGTFARKVTSTAEVLWGSKAGGFALMATKLGISPFTNYGYVKMSCDDLGWLFVNNVHMKDVEGAGNTAIWRGPLKTGDTIMIKGKDIGGKYGCSVQATYVDEDGVLHTTTSDFFHWQALSISMPQAKKLEHTLKHHPVSTWKQASRGNSATLVARKAYSIWGPRSGGFALIATTLGAPPVFSYGYVRFSCDDHGWLFINGKHVKDVHGASNIATWYGTLNTGDSIVIKGKEDGDGKACGCTSEIVYNDAQGMRKIRTTDFIHWRSLSVSPDQAKNRAQTLLKNPPSSWKPAVEGNSAMKVSPSSEILWGATKGGYAFLATTLGGPPNPNYGHVKFSCDDHGWLFINGKHVKDVHGWQSVAIWRGPLKSGDTVLIKAKDDIGWYGCTAEVVYVANGVLRTQYTNYWHWRAISIKHKDNIGHVMKHASPSSWCRASQGTYARRVHRRAAVVWGSKENNFALIATKLR